MTQPLDGAYHKVARARKHLDELRFETKQFTDSAPYSLTGAYEPPDDHFVMRWQVHRPAPLRLGLIAGDVVHNLRSALDHVVYQLSVAGGGTGRRTQFPISEDEADYDKSTDVFLEGIGSEMRATIKALQPFHAKTAKVFHPSDLKPGHPMARNLFLLVVGRLDNVDKHRNLFPVAGVSPFQKPEFEGAMSASGSYPADWILVADGAEYCRVTDLRVRKGVTEVRLKTPPPYTIVFGDAAFGPPGSPNDLWSDKTKASASPFDLTLACDAIEKIIGLFAAETYGPCARYAEGLKRGPAGSWNVDPLPSRSSARTNSRPVPRRKRLPRDTTLSLVSVLAHRAWSHLFLPRSGDRMAPGQSPGG